VTYEDQIVALFAQANPVPSLDLLDPVEPLDIEHLGQRSERSSVMTDLKTDEIKTEEGRRWPRLVPVIAMAVIAVVTVALLLNRETAVVSPESVATAYMEARQDLDTEAALALLSADADVLDDGWGLDHVPAYFDWFRASNWDWAPGECEAFLTNASGTLVRCPYAMENDWTRALDHPPVTGKIDLLVADGEIIKLTQALDISQFEGVWSAFSDWIVENHLDDYQNLYTADRDGPLISPSATALWAQYTEEFVASFEGES
jgi:hypothetical protein